MNVELLKALSLRVNLTKLQKKLWTKIYCQQESSGPFVSFSTGHWKPPINSGKMVQGMLCISVFTPPISL